jgi:ribosomal protein S4E
MQDRGYWRLDVNTLPQSRKRKKIVVLFQESAGYGDSKAMSEEYWVVDGRDMSSDNFKLVFEPGTQITDPNAPPSKLIGYRVMQDDLGKFTKTPIYGDEQKSSAKEYRVVDRRDVSSDNFKIVFEPGTEITDPNAPPRKLTGYRIRQDDLGKFTKTPVYQDEQKSSAKEYRVVDRRDMSSDNFKIVFEPGTEITDPNAPPRKLTGYRVRQDDLGKFTKTPIYGDEQKSSAKEYRVVDRRDMSSENFKIVFEPGTEITDPNAPSRKLTGYRIRQDDLGKFTKTPIYGDEQKSSAKEYRVVDRRDMSSENFKIVFEPGTEITDPNAPPRKLTGFRVRQDDLGKFTKTPVYQDE